MNIDRFALLLQRSGLIVSLMAGLFALTACGGGGGSSSSSSSSLSSVESSSSYSAASAPGNGTGTWPSVKVDATGIKTLTFNWSAVAGAASYKLFKNQGGNSGYVQVGDAVTGTSATDTISVHVHDWINTRYQVVAYDGSGVELTTNGSSSITFTATEMVKAIGYVKASNADLGDWFGWSVAISGDGKTLAVGAPAEDSTATGANGDQSNNESANSGAVYVFVKDDQGLWTQQAYLKASNTEQPSLNSARFLPNDRFGFRVALSDDGNTLAVSSLLEDSPSYGINCNEDNYEVTSSASSGDTTGDYISAKDYNLGAVYMFQRTGSDWAQSAYVKPRYSVRQLTVTSGTDLTGLRFGDTLALSGDGKTLAVGAKADSLAASGTLTYSSQSSSLGCLIYYPSSSSSSSSSTSSSSSSSSTSSYSGGALSGAVYIYVLGDSGWEEEAYVRASNAETGDSFGASVALSTDGNTLAVGALGEDSDATGINGDQSNNACYYSPEINKISDATLENYLAASYALDSDCSKSTRLGNLQNGAAYVFTRSDKVWSQQAYFKPAVAYATYYTKTLYGSSIDLSGDGNTLAVGAAGDASTAMGINGDASTNETSKAGSGAVYVYTRTGSSWAQQSYIKQDNPRAGQYFGEHLSLSKDGNILAVGTQEDQSAAIGINGDEGDTSADAAGAVTIYQRTAGAWSKSSYVKASNTQAQDHFGLSLDLSDDGSTLAVGANRESSNAQGVGGDQTNNDAISAGAVYLY